jgi:hypothetical protein
MRAITVVRHVPTPLAGVCGPVLDHRVRAFEAELDWLEINGVVVDRIDPILNLLELERLPEAAELWRTDGASALPLILVGGHVRSRGCFPPRGELVHLVATCTGASSVDAVRHVASLAVAAALGRDEDIARERAAAAGAGLDEESLELIEDAGRHTIARDASHGR